MACPHKDVVITALWGRAQLIHRNYVYESKTPGRTLMWKVCGREAMMQEKSNEQRKRAKRGYNLLDKEEEKSMLSCLWNSWMIRLFYFVCGSNISSAAGIWGHVHYTCSSAFKCHSRVIQEEAKRAVRHWKNDKSACTAPWWDDPWDSGAIRIWYQGMCLPWSRRVPADIGNHIGCQFKIEEESAQRALFGS